MKAFKIKKVLVPIDFSETSLNALDHAVNIAKMNDAEITLIHVVESLLVTSDPEYFSMIQNIEYENDIVKQSRIHLNKLAEKINQNGLTTKINTIAIIGRTHTEIIEESTHGTDIIVMGTHGVSGFFETVVGSNTYRVINDADCPVLSIREQVKTTGFKNIFVPFNNQPHSREGVMYAIKMAQLYTARLSVLGVDIENTDYGLRTIELQANQIKSIAEECGIVCHTETISSGYFADKILEHAKNINADLIIEMTGMERLSIAEYFIESFEKRMINHSPIPVLSVRSTFNTDTVDMRFY